MAPPTSSPIFITHPNGQRTHIYDNNFTDPWKSHETILIQHGFGRHGGFWYHWIPYLARRYRVIRRDARGHGLSSYPQAGDNYDYSAETIVSEIVDTLDQLSLSKVHFLGESTSGIVGQMLAAKHPDRLSSLITCSSPAFLPEAALSLFAFGHSSWPAACRALGSRGWAEALSKVPGTVTFPDPAYVLWWIEQVSISSGEGLAGYAEFLSRADARPYLKAIPIPTLILAPGRSAATTVDEQRAIAAHIPNSQLVVVDGQGHEIYVDKAEECQEAVTLFLSSLSR